jgi:hypothetical protein
LVAALPVLAAPQGLGTLFLTPEERERLDRMRRGEPEIPAAAAPVAGRPSAVTGFVKRSDGRHTVWIDGMPVPVRGPDSAPVLDPRAVRAYSDREDDALRVERKAPR